jgi:hemoglobin-like flavoprotein
MTPDQKQLVQESWREVAPIAETAAELFYGRLFEIDPTTPRLFEGVNLTEQRRKLVQALAGVVHGLDDLEALVPALADLGRRHARYGVVDGQYDTVGAALLWTLEQGLGPAWTPDVKLAWSVAYARLTDVMREGAGESPSAPAKGACPD